MLFGFLEALNKFIRTANASLREMILKSQRTGYRLPTVENKLPSIHSFTHRDNGLTIVRNKHGISRETLFCHSKIKQQGSQRRHFHPTKRSSMYNLLANNFPVWCTDRIRFIYLIIYPPKFTCPVVQFAYAMTSPWIRTQALVNGRRIFKCEGPGSYFVCVANRFGQDGSRDSVDVRD